jgi:hypothetical protein
MELQLTRKRLVDLLNPPHLLWRRQSIDFFISAFHVRKFNILVMDATALTIWQSSFLRDDDVRRPSNTFEKGTGRRNESRTPERKLWNCSYELGRDSKVHEDQIYE